MSEVFLTRRGGGGGVGLKLRVVGGSSRPEAPKENTIWVNTDTDITSWAFSPEQPESPAEGMVWFRTGNASAVSLELLGKNSVILCPVLASIYTAGSWAAAEAAIYQQGWQPFETLLFDTASATVEDLSRFESSQGSWSLDPEGMKFTAREYFGEADFWAYYGGVLDLTAYKTLYIRVRSCTDGGETTPERFGIVSQDAPTTWVVMERSDDSWQELSLDISGLSGGCRIAFKTSWGSRWIQFSRLELKS